MLKRKIYSRIEQFYRENPSKALMITGARQVGKSYIIERFAREHYKHYIRIDFIEHPEYISIFSAANSTEDILLRLSALFGDDMKPGETMIFFDEVQECKELITQIKYLVSNDNYAYILSGSLLGTIFTEIRSVPVGYIEIIPMYPMDFEEFAIANGVNDKVFTALKEAFIKKTAIDSFLHKRMMSLLELYLIIGGMPAAVEIYTRTKNLSSVVREQNSIIELYKQDISKYDKEEKLYLNEIFDLIPSELKEKNKRFILKSLNENARFSKYNNSFIWLKNAGVALPCHIVDELRLPLLLSKSTNLFKLFMCDVGLLAAQYGDGIQMKILNHETSMNFGSIYENLAAQELHAHGHTLFFYNSKKYGEIDFVIEHNGEVLPVEIKSGKDYYRHNAMNHVLDCKEYDTTDGYVFCGGNIEVKDNITYYPIYMIGFLKKDSMPEDAIYNPDFSDINNIIC